MNTTIPKFIRLTATGLLAGAFLYGLLNVVPTFYEVPLNVHLIYRIQLMRHNSITMQLLMFASFVFPIWFAITHRHQRMVMMISLLSAALALIALLVTRFSNVPINQMIKTWSPEHLSPDWIRQLREWDRYNLIRVLSGLTSFLAFIVSTQLASRTNSP